MEHSFPFDPTYGYSREALLRVGAPAEPADLAGFWRGTYAETLGVATRVARREVKSAWPGVMVYEVEFDSLDGFRVGGWLTAPRGRKVEACVVVGHGYGGREGPDAGIAQMGVAAIYPCGRGFNRSARSGYPGNSGEHVVHGIGARETYSHRGCVADIWAAATVLGELYPEGMGRLGYAGGSFGGGIGAMALAWDERFVRGYLDVPSFGNHPLRVTMECVGSGEAVRKLYRERPGVMEVLRYFDAAVCARHVRVPVLVAAAEFDPAVPPPGQFAVYNMLGGEKKLVVRTAAHFEFAGGEAEDAMVFEAVREWFGWTT